MRRRSASRDTVPLRRPPFAAENVQGVHLSAMSPIAGCTSRGRPRASPSRITDRHDVVVSRRHTGITPRPAQSSGGRGIEPHQVRLTFGKWARGGGTMRLVTLKAGLISFVVCAMLAGVSPLAAAGASPKAAGGLGAAAGYAVLAGTALTCTDSNVAGPVGVDFTTAVTSTRCKMQVQYAPG